MEKMKEKYEKNISYGCTGIAQKVIFVSHKALMVFKLQWIQIHSSVLNS